MTTKKRTARSTKKEPVTTWLVPMTKDEQTIEVHPRQVVHHEAMGWKKAK